MESRTHRRTATQSPSTAPLHFTAGFAIGIAALVVYLFQPSFIPLPSALLELVASGGLACGVLLILSGVVTLLMDKQKTRS